MYVWEKAAFFFNSFRVKQATVIYGELHWIGPERR